MENRQPQLADVYGEQIARVARHLAERRRPSEIANALHAEGIGNIVLLAIFREVTGAGIADLKNFGRWWGPEGVTDVAEFDSWAAQVFRTD